MTSLEDRYGSMRLDALIHTCWSRGSDDSLLTVSVLRASRHLARAWPTDLPLRRSFRAQADLCVPQARDLTSCLRRPLDDCSYLPVLARKWHVVATGRRIGDVPEFIGVLDRERLAGWLVKRGVDPAAYSLEGGHPSERYVLDRPGQRVGCLLLGARTRNRSALVSARRSGLSSSCRPAMEGPHRSP